MDAPFGAFCHAVRTDDWLFVSGLTARSDDIAAQDIVVQTDVVMERLKGVLEAEGGTLADVIRVRWPDVYWPGASRETCRGSSSASH